MADMGRTVAVVGASNNRRKYGNKALRAFRHRGYTVIPINPNEQAVEGIRAYASVLDAPGVIELATVYVRPAVGEPLMAELAARGIQEVWLNPGADDAAVVARARAVGIEPTLACSIRGIGEDPGEY